MATSGRLVKHTVIGVVFPRQTDCFSIAIVLSNASPKGSVPAKTTCTFSVTFKTEFQSRQPRLWQWVQNNFLLASFSPKFWKSQIWNWMRQHKSKFQQIKTKSKNPPKPESMMRFQNSSIYLSPPALLWSPHSSLVDSSKVQNKIRWTIAQILCLRFIRVKVQP